MFNTLTRKIKSLFMRSEAKRRHYAVRAASFIHDNKESLVIIADLDTDTIVVGYQDLIVPGRFGKEGENRKVVKKALKFPKNQAAIDQFLYGLGDSIMSIARQKNTIDHMSPADRAAMKAQQEAGITVEFKKAPDPGLSTPPDEAFQK